LPAGAAAVAWADSYDTGTPAAKPVGAITAIRSAFPGRAAALQSARSKRSVL